MTAAAVERAKYQVATNLLQTGFKREDIETALEKARERADVPLEPFSYQIFEVGSEVGFFAWARIVE